MTTPWLHGNHDPCPACALRRAEVDTRPIRRAAVPCNLCGGAGYLALPDAEIVRRMAAAAAAYWRQFDRRNGLAPDIQRSRR